MLEELKCEMRDMWEALEQEKQSRKDIVIYLEHEIAWRKTLVEEVEDLKDEMTTLKQEREQDNCIIKQLQNEIAKMNNKMKAQVQAPLPPLPLPSCP